MCREGKPWIRRKPRKLVEPPVQDLEGRLRRNTPLNSWIFWSPDLTEILTYFTSIYEKNTKQSFFNDPLPQIEEGRMAGMVWEIFVATT